MKKAISGNGILIIFISLIFMGVNLNYGAIAPKEIHLWKNNAPGEPAIDGEERDTTKPSDALVGGKPVIRLGNVTKPTLTFYPSDKNRDGETVVIFPGGGYHILAMDLEGTEIAAWLNSIGIHAAVVKYRVPARKNQERYKAPLQDAQRAIRIVRANAKEWGVNPERIGVLGFSAGAHLAATLCANASTNAYEAVDEIDKLNSKPNFQVLVYPAYLTIKDKDDTIAPEVAVSSNTPPTFLIQTQDDPIRVETSLFYYLALKKAGVKAELHIFPAGGHGYGLRQGKRTATLWPTLLESWLKELFGYSAN
ncbi:MAG: alpha/beta hydrolase [Verrucomicrobiia bacterium]|jgi:acetyl esterase/lipase